MENIIKSEQYFNITKEPRVVCPIVKNIQKHFKQHVNKIERIIDEASDYHPEDQIIGYFQTNNFERVSFDEIYSHMDSMFAWAEDWSKLFTERCIEKTSDSSSQKEMLFKQRVFSQKSKWFVKNCKSTNYKIEMLDLDFEVEYSNFVNFINLYNDKLKANKSIYSKELEEELDENISPLLVKITKIYEKLRNELEQLIDTNTSFRTHMNDYVKVFVKKELSDINDDDYKYLLHLNAR